MARIVMYTCPECEGSKVVDDEVCIVCGGRGEIDEDTLDDHEGRTEINIKEDKQWR